MKIFSSPIRNSQKKHKRHCELLKESNKIEKQSKINYSNEIAYEVWISNFEMSFECFNVHLQNFWTLHLISSEANQFISLNIVLHIWKIETNFEFSSINELSIVNVINCIAITIQFENFLLLSNNQSKEQECFSSFSRFALSLMTYAYAILDADQNA